MPVVKCPGCQQPLNLGEHLGGSWVMCPACKYTFQAPSTAPPVAVPVNLPPPVAAPVASFQPNPAAFDFGESENARLGKVRVDAAIKGAASWLQMCVFFCVLMSLVCFSAPNTFGNMGLVLMLLATIFLIYIPMILVAIGSSAMQHRRSYGMAMMASILALFLALVHVLPTIGALVLLFAAIASGRPETFVFALMVLGLSGFVVASGLLGGIKTLLVLRKPEVASSFGRPLTEGPPLLGETRPADGQGSS